VGYRTRLTGLLDLLLLGKNFSLPQLGVEKRGVKSHNRGLPSIIRTLNIISAALSELVSQAN